ncbi:hypothetical protein AB4Z46_07365 [Variovorax sp. M-6]|uniref:hypothetical protein n=1 Tax=Variovorax sp. M-6 TaxID=3233041 RepID=UPI003F9A1AA2
MQSAIFAVGNEPYLLWEQDVAERTRDFLDGLDPEFFSYVLKAHTKTDDEKRASVSIRLALHHATETMFSLLCALVQAPDCPYAWISRCSNTELRDVVKRISEGDHTLLSKFKLAGMGWNPIASLVFETFEPGTERQLSAIRGSSKLWSGLAREHLSDAVIDEYNATKHGFRTRPGGFKIEIGPVTTPDLTPEEAEMTLIGESKFGAMFYKVEKLDVRGGRQIRSRVVATNWAAQRDIHLLQLTQNSISNAVTRLKIANGVDPSSCEFLLPDNEEDFSRPWEHSPGVTSVYLPFGADPEAVPDFSKDELLRRLRDALGGNVPAPS